MPEGLTILQLKLEADLLLNLGLLIANIVIAAFIFYQTKYIGEQAAFIKEQVRLQARDQFARIVLTLESPIMRDALINLKKSIAEIHRFVESTLRIIDKYGFLDEQAVVESAKSLLRTLTDPGSSKDLLLKQLGTCKYCVNSLRSSLERIENYATRILKRSDQEKAIDKISSMLLRLDLIQKNLDEQQRLVEDLFHYDEFSTEFIESHLSELKREMLMRISARSETDKDIQDLVLLSFARALHIRYLILPDITRDMGEDAITLIKEYLKENCTASLRDALNHLHSKGVISEENLDHIMYLLNEGKRKPELSVKWSTYAQEKIKNVTLNQDEQKAIEETLTALITSDYSNLSENLRITLNTLEIAMLHLISKVEALKTTTEAAANNLSLLLNLRKEHVDDVILKASHDAEQKYEKAVDEFILRISAGL